VSNGTHAEKSLGADARLRGYVRERAVSVVPVERASQWRSWLEDLGCRTIHQIEIEQAVLIVVDPGAARAHGFNQVFLAGCSVLVAEGDAGGFGDIHEPDRAARASQ
jgi:hypothetical protein